MTTILVVDDMPIFRDPIAASLRLAGYQTITAANGQEALAKIKAQRPDAILLDVAMPVMDGLTFLGILRSDPTLRDLPVILLTADSDKTRVLQAAKLGIQEYLLKSRFSLKELLERVKKHVSTQPVPAVGAAAPTANHAAPTASTPSLAPASSPPQQPRPTAIQPAPSTAPVSIPRLLTQEQCAQRTQNALAAKALSGVVAQVIAMAASPRGDMSELANMISKDPALAARVLQAANSAAYACGRGMVTTVSEAVRNVGCSTIRNIAMNFGIFDAMPSSGDGGFSPIRCWQHSFGVATLCERLAGGDEQQAGTAYLVGLCHDLGEILFHTHFAPEYRQVLELESSTGKPRHELERLMLGTSHGDLVTLILQSIGLPQNIQNPIQAFHSGNQGNGDSARLARILRMAESAANGMLLASSPAARLIPFSRSECRDVSGQENPASPDPQLLRSEIFALAGLLGRLSHRDHADLMAPLYPPTQTRICLVRHPSLSSFDPVQMALSSMAEVVLLDHLPAKPDEWTDCRALAVVVPTTSAKGFRSEDIARTLALRTAGPLPALWLVGQSDNSTLPPSSSLQPIRWPVCLDQLATLTQTALPQSANAAAAA